MLFNLDGVGARVFVLLALDGVAADSKMLLMGNEDSLGGFRPDQFVPILVCGLINITQRVVF